MEIVAVIVVLIVGAAILVAVFSGNPAVQVEKAQLNLQQAQERVRDSAQSGADGVLSRIRASANESPNSLHIFELSQLKMLYIHKMMYELTQAGHFDALSFVYQLSEENTFNDFDKLTLIAAFLFHDVKSRVPASGVDFATFVKTYCHENMSAENYAQSFEGEGSEWDGDEILQFFANNAEDESQEYLDNVTVQYVARMKSYLNNDGAEYRSFVEQLKTALPFVQLPGDDRAALALSILES